MPSGGIAETPILAASPTWWPARGPSPATTWTTRSPCRSGGSATTWLRPRPTASGSGWPGSRRGARPSCGPSWRPWPPTAAGRGRACSTSSPGSSRRGTRSAWSTWSGTGSTWTTPSTWRAPATSPKESGPPGTRLPEGVQQEDPAGPDQGQEGRQPRVGMGHVRARLVPSDGPPPPVGEEEPGQPQEEEGKEPEQGELQQRLPNRDHTSTLDRARCDSMK